MGYWIVSLILYKFLMYNQVFKNMSHSSKRNVITYILELVATTISFFILTIEAPRLITVTDVEKQFDEFLGISAGISLMFYLYIFEIIYKASINIQLAVHHVLTIVMTLLTCFMVWDTFNVSAIYPIIMVYSAITEQPVFISLLLYRFNKPSHNWFIVSIVTGFISKTFVFSMVWVVIKKALMDVDYQNIDTGNNFNWKEFMIYMLSIANVVMYIVQVYSINIYWKLYLKSKNKFMCCKIKNTVRDDPVDKTKIVSEE